MAIRILRSDINSTGERERERERERGASPSHGREVANGRKEGNERGSERKTPLPGIIFPAREGESFEKELEGMRNTIFYFFPLFNFHLTVSYVRPCSFSLFLFNLIFIKRSLLKRYMLH